MEDPMQGYELTKQIEKERRKNPDNIFIKWWRREEDWLDFDLISRFLETLKPSEDIGGFELIDQDEMWRTIERRCKGRVKKVERNGEWMVAYTPPKNAEVEEREPVYPYTPESLITILDLESDYNYVD
jgi:hypothetical protein